MPTGCNSGRQSPVYFSDDPSIAGDDRPVLCEPFSSDVKRILFWMFGWTFFRRGTNRAGAR